MKKHYSMRFPGHCRKTCSQGKHFTPARFLEGEPIAPLIFLMGDLVQEIRTQQAGSVRISYGCNKFTPGSIYFAAPPPKPRQTGPTKRMQAKGFPLRESHEGNQSGCCVAALRSCQR